MPLLLMIGYSSILAQNSTARFLLSTPSARSMALGGTGTAYAYDAMTPFTNPAGISFVKPLDFTASFLEPNPFEEDREYWTFSGVLLQGGYGTLAFSLNKFTLGSQVWTSEASPEILGIDKSKAWVYRLSYAYLFKQNFSCGITLNYFDYQLSKLELTAGAKKDRATSQSLFFNLGFLYGNIFSQYTICPDHIAVPSWIEKITHYTPRQGLTIGLSLINLGRKISFIQDDYSDNLPAFISLGISYPIVDCRAVGVNLGLDFEKQFHESSVLDNTRFGCEYNLFQLFYIRAGYVLDLKHPKRSYDTYGFGLHLEYVSVDLARYQKGFYEISHYSGTLHVEL